ncbi:type IX secretion system membrane protein PorP/SprF [Robiginitalea sp. M366]|uniref:PorP/SprF family type IX secretion system membrane protein n=1 Tax=Robiginitalea aestuariiviva TaxID=3036903 RepID=UPI00240E8A65|nr:type IX secretion system membrane protein PorP/SprF [Robiginitalea aestuariiviva]MDG1570971.1 type IX secretion system membrane protein PorP/SprF [Robiginitalea aestuariiviva]
MDTDYSMKGKHAHNQVRAAARLKSILLLGFCFWVLGALAQREPLYTQYMYNIGSFNPAYVGSVENTDISLLYRAQWIDLPGAPRTLRFGINMPVGEQHGLGFNAVSDQLGPTTQAFVDVSYSFQVNLSEDAYLSFGLDAGGSFLNTDFSKGSFENPGEPILDQQTVNAFYPTVGAGIFMYQEHWYLGASVPNFLTDALYSNEVAQIVEDRLQFNFIGGYVFNLSQKLRFKPAFLVNYISGAPATVNGSANFLWNDVLTLGMAYRFDNAVSTLAGFQVTPSLYLGYAYDYNTNGLGGYNSGSHEVVLKFYLGRGGFRRPSDSDRDEDKPKGKQIDSPRFF